MSRRLADEVVGVLTPNRKLRDRAYVQLTTYLTCLLMNFYVLRLTAPGRRLSISLNSNFYITDTNARRRRQRRKSLPVADEPFTYATATKAVDGLTLAGYLKRAPGFYDKKRKRGVVTQFQPTAHLAKLLDTLDPSVVQIKERKPLVELRPSKKERKALRKAGRPTEMTWPNTHRGLKSKLVANVRKINRALRKQFQGVCVPDDVLKASLRKHERPVNLFSDAVHRTFTQDPLKGGRFVGAWWHTLPNNAKPEQGKVALRPHIKMARKGEDPQPIAELDYEALHFRMMYAMSDEPCDSDPYSIYDDPAKSALTRKAVKSLALKVINAPSREAALRSMKRQINRDLFPEWWKKNHPGEPWPEFEPGTAEDQKMALLWPGCPPLGTLMTDIERKHKPIAKHLCTAAGRYLMYEESELASQIMLRMIGKHGICPLPMHDSFLVPQDLEAPLRRIMQEQFVARFGVSIPITKKPSAPAYEVPPSSVYFRFVDLWRVEQGKAIPVSAV